jgi:periplasmic copper chaperone A
MKRRVLLLSPLSLPLMRRARAASYTLGAISVENPWAKPSVTDAAAMFLTLLNAGPRADRLVGGLTPIAEHVILRELDGSPLEYLELEPRRPVVLRPGRRYIALRGLRRLLAVDDRFPMNLRFAEAGTLELWVTVLEGPADS